MPSISVVTPAESAGFTRGDIIRVLASEHGTQVTDLNFANMVGDRINETIDRMAQGYSWRFSLQFGADNLSTIGDQDSYDLQTLFPGYDEPAWMFQQTTPFLLKYLPYREFMEKFPEQDLTGLSYFYTLKGDDDAVLWPTPNVDGLMSFAYYSQLPHLTEDSQRMFWRGKHDQVLLKGARWLMTIAMERPLSEQAKREEEFDMGLRWMRLDDCYTPDHKMRIRMDRENRSRYGTARENSRDWRY